MDFSESFRFAGKCCFSPCGRYVAHMKDLNIVLSDAETLQIMNTYSCIDTVNQVEWAPDSEHVLCAMHKLGVVQVWSLRQSEWRCRIDEGAAGIAHARWSPDSRHILSVADFQVRVAVRSLVNRTVVYLDCPKFSSKGFSFSSDGRWMALLGRSEGQDHVFPVGSSDATDIAWSPDDRYIAVWDSPLEFKLMVYLPNGTQLCRYSAYENQLGIKTVSWSPSGQFMAVGSFDNCVRIFNNISWKVIGEYKHEAITALPLQRLCEAVGVGESHCGFQAAKSSLSAIAYYERLDTANQSSYVIGHYMGGGSLGGGAGEAPFSVPVERLDTTDPNPKLGVGMSSWSADSRYLATRCDAMPCALWIWETLGLSLYSLIVQNAVISCAMWDPTQSRLALCTGNNKVYFWSGNGCSCVDVPAEDFCVRKAAPDLLIVCSHVGVVSQLAWSPHGEYLVLQDKSQFCVCYMAGVEF